MNISSEYRDHVTNTAARSFTMIMMRDTGSIQEHDFNTIILKYNSGSEAICTE